LSNSRIEQWDQRYRAGEQDFDVPSPLAVQFTRGLPAGSALDVASGPGRNALYLAQHGWRVRALDGSQVAIDLLLARARERNLAVDARAVDLESSEIEIEQDAFHLVLSCYYFQRSLIPRMQAALRPGGLLIMIVHLADADQPQGTPARAYPGELLTFFDGWRILHYREGNPAESCHRHGVAELVAERS
jgi:tellurite methyltransferase